MLTSPQTTPARLVLTTLGSLGDLHPLLALGQALAARGHSVLVATHAHYEKAVRAAGVAFAPVRPGMADLGSEVRWSVRLMEAQDGSEFLFRSLLLPWLRASVADLNEACCAWQPDLIVAQSLMFAAPLVAERRGIPLLGVALQPQVLFSARDPSLLPQVPWLYSLRRLGPFPHRLAHALALEAIRPWFEGLERVREAMGLARSHVHPMRMALFQRAGLLCLFSRHFAAPQADWPAGSEAVGFPFYDHGELSIPTRAFLAHGEAPVVHTLGSCAVNAAGGFWETAARALAPGRRGIFLVGRNAHAELRSRFLMENRIHVSAYEPFGDLFPYASAIVHQAGIGTTAQALRAGVPQVCVPFAHDQPDNASRVERLGAGRRLPIARLSEAMLSRALEGVLTDARVRARAKQLGEKIACEDFALAACAKVEGVLLGRQRYPTGAT